MAHRHSFPDFHVHIPASLADAFVALAMVLLLFGLAALLPNIFP